MSFTLESIQRTDTIRPPRILIYGPGGIGKTTFAAGAPDPVFLFTEDGAGALKVNAFPIVQSMDDVMAAIATLYQEEHGFQTLVLDSIDHLEPHIWRAVCQERSVENIEDIGYGKGYVMALDHWHTILDGLEALRRERGMSIILIGHADVKRYDNPTTDSYDRYQPKLDRRALELVIEDMDAVLFANLETRVKVEDLGFGNQKRRGIETGRRILHTSEKPAFRAKNRYGLPAELDLSWASFSAALTESTSQAA